MLCKNCGTELFEGATFCAACGERACDSSAQVEATSAAPGAVGMVASKKGEEGSAMKVALIAVAIIGLIILLLMQCHVCDYCEAPFFGKSYRAQGYDFLCPDCGSRNAPFVVENDLLAF